MINNLQRRRMQNPNLMQQGQNMLAQQQQDFNNWYDIGNSIGGAFFPNMANGKSDGKYGDSIVAGPGKTDKENFELGQGMMMNSTDSAMGILQIVVLIM